MQHFPESELILNPDGSIYHLHLRPEDISTTIITVGDPDRVSDVSQHFDTIEVKRQHREFVTHTGMLGNKRLTVISTGIGTDNIDIVFNELDALANIDFSSRTLRPAITTLNFIRVGTSGSLQADIPVDSLLVSTYGLGLDGLMDFYEFEDDNVDLLDAFADNNWEVGGLPYPYLAAGSDALIAAIGKDDFLRGITATCTGFYGPQGRQLRGAIYKKDIIEQLSSFKHEQHRITNFEMETAGIYGLSRLLGHNALSVNAILANRITQQFSTQGQKTVDAMIKTVLERILATDFL